MAQWPTLEELHAWPQPSSVVLVETWLSFLETGNWTCF